jgi:small subunit ribosomal protein S16
LQTPAVIKIDETKALAWLSEGAKPTDTVKSLFSKQGIMQKFHESKRNQ